MRTSEQSREERSRSFDSGLTIVPGWHLTFILTISIGWTSWEKTPCMQKEITWSASVRASLYFPISSLWLQPVLFCGGGLHIIFGGCSSTCVFVAIVFCCSWRVVFRQIPLWQWVVCVKMQRFGSPAKKDQYNESSNNYIWWRWWPEPIQMTTSFPSNPDGNAGPETVFWIFRAGIVFAKRAVWWWWWWWWWWGRWLWWQWWG